MASSIKMYLSRLFTEKKLAVPFVMLALLFVELLLIPSDVQEVPGGLKYQILRDSHYYGARKSLSGALPFRNLVLTPISVVDALLPEDVSPQVTATGKKKEWNEQHMRAAGNNMTTVSRQVKGAEGEVHQGRTGKGSKSEMQQAHRKDRENSHEIRSRDLEPASAKLESVVRVKPVHETALSRNRGEVVPQLSVIDGQFSGRIPQQYPFTGKMELHYQGKDLLTADQEEDMKLLHQRSFEAGLTESERARLIESYKELCKVLPRSEAQKMIMFRIYRQANKGASAP